MNLSELLKDFFHDYLQEQRSLSLNTIRSYRDTFKLLIHDLQATHGPNHLPCIDDLDVKTVLAFLKHLEDPLHGRGNSPNTRNQRLAAIQCFFHYLSLHHPSLEHQARRIAAIPSKRVPAKEAAFLDRKELDALLAQPRTDTSDGVRDLAILMFLYNAAARASEAAEFRLSSFNFENRTVTILGKGRKQRTTPLWPSTARLLKLYAERHRRKPKPVSADYFFINRRGQAFNRFGIRAVVKRFLKTAAVKCPSLASKRLSTHSLRHTTAVNLTESRVGPNVLKAWLGHASVTAGDHYRHTDLNHKRRILEQFGPPHYVNDLDNPKPAGPGTNALDWLDDL